MATHSSVLAWRIPWMEVPSIVGFRLWGRTESDTTEATKQQQDIIWELYRYFFKCKKEKTGGLNWEDFLIHYLNAEFMEI